MKLGSNVLVCSLAECMGQVREQALKMLEFVPYLLQPRPKEFIWIDWALVSSGTNNSSVLVLVALGVMPRPHVAATSMAWVLIATRGVQVDESVHSKLTVFHVSVIQQLDGRSC